MTVSDTAREALYALTTDQVFVELIEIRHPDLDSVLRFSNTSEDFVITDEDGETGGDVYQAWAFALVWPDSASDRPPEAKIAFDNINTAITAVLRSLDVRPAITLKLVRAAQPYITEKEWRDLELYKTSYNAGNVTLSIGMIDLANEPAAQVRFTPNLFKSLE